VFAAPACNDHLLGAECLKKAFPVADYGTVDLKADECSGARASSPKNGLKMLHTCPGKRKSDNSGNLTQGMSYTAWNSDCCEKKAHMEGRKGAGSCEYKGHDRKSVSVDIATAQTAALATVHDIDGRQTRMGCSVSYETYVVISIEALHGSEWCPLAMPTWREGATGAAGDVAVASTTTQNRVLMSM
jgi:hypothetical protein